MKSKDSYEKNIQKKCVVCRRPVMVHQYGGGFCGYCGWYQNVDDEQTPTAVIFPNLVSLERARLLVQEGKPLVPTLGDFCGGLAYYGEMQFEFNGVTFGAFRKNDGSIEFASNPENVQRFNSKEEFMEKATISGALLKDIWDQVENPSYM